MLRVSPATAHSIVAWPLMPGHPANRGSDDGAGIAALEVVARIRARRRGLSLQVVISGRLTSLDMRRLEHVCGEALARVDPRVDIHLRAVTYLDATAVAILQRLQARGIRLLGHPQLRVLPVSLARRDPARH